MASPTPLIMVMHGINLNMFGKRDPGHYGQVTLDEINSRISLLGAELGVTTAFFQSNHEGEFIEKIHELHGGKAEALVINAGAWTHYSYGLMDALAVLTIPIVEVHMSNVQAREPFRHFSVLSTVAKGSVVGFGVDSYLLGLRAAAGLVGV